MSPPKPAPTDFRLHIDDVPTSIGLQTYRDAEKVAAEFVAQGHKVEIYDQITGKVLKRMG